MEVRHVEQCAAETMDLQVVAEQLTCGEGLAQARNSRFDQDVPATDVDAAVAEQLGQLVKVAGLRGENRDAQLGCEAAELVDLPIGDGLLEPVIAELLEDSAGFQRLQVAVRASGVLHQREVGAHCLSSRPEAREVAFEAVPELNLEAAETRGLDRLCFLVYLVWRRVDRARRRVCRDRAPGKPEQSCDRHVEGLAANVPDSDVQRPDDGIRDVVYVAVLSPQPLPDR